MLRPMRDQVRIVSAVARDPRMARIELAFFGFGMSEYGTWIAILVYAYDRGGATAAGLVAAIQLVPAGLVAPFGAFAGDRFARDRVLFVSYLAQAVALGVVAIALSADAPFGLTLVFATVAAASMTFTRPTQAALLPSVAISPKELTAANSVSTMAESASLVVGPFVAGVVLARTGPAAVFALFAMVVFVGALLVARLDVDFGGMRPEQPMDARDVAREAFGGFRALADERRAGLLVILLAASMFLLGALDVIYVGVAIDLLHKGQGWAGFLNSAAGVGALVGALLTVALVGRRRLVPSLTGGSLLFGAPITAVGAAPSPVSAPFLFAAAGAGASVSWMAGNTLLQRIAPDEVLARVFGIVEGLGTLGTAAGALSASALMAAFGVRTALIVVGALAPISALALWVPLSAIDREGKAPDAETLKLIRAIPIFAPLPAPAIQRILVNLTRTELAAGDVLMSEGDVGERFYVIESGEAEVTRDGTHVTDRGVGEYVGEISLLRDVPRTATVTARTPMTVLSLEREPFLEAVTGHPQSHARVEAIVDERMPADPDDR